MSLAGSLTNTYNSIISNRSRVYFYSARFFMKKEIQKAELLPTNQILPFERNENGLIVDPPQKISDELTYANVIKILSQ